MVQNMNGRLRVSRVAKMLGCSKSKVHCLIEEGRLDAIRVRPHGWWGVDPESVQRYVQQLDGGTPHRKQQQ